MSFSSLIGDYIGNGLASARPVTPNVAAGVSPFYYSTDTPVLEVWDGTAWQPVGGGGGALDVEDEGTPEVVGASVLNFIGAGVTVVDAGSGVADITIPGGGGGGAWTLVNTTTIAAPVPEVDVIGLGTPTDIMVVVQNVTVSVSGIRAVRLSVDNGATFFSASGDYESFSAAGAVANRASIEAHTTSNAGARGGVVVIMAANTAAAERVVDAMTTGTTHLFGASTSQINAIRVLNTVTADLTGGTIYVFTR